MQKIYTYDAKLSYNVGDESILCEVNSFYDAFLLLENLTNMYYWSKDWQHLFNEIKYLFLSLRPSCNLDFSYCLDDTNLLKVTCS